MKKLFTLLVLVSIIPNVWSQEVATPINNVGSVVTTNWGRVGIGTTSPGERLDVNGTIRTTRIKLKNTAVFTYDGEKSYLSPGGDAGKGLLMSQLGFTRLNASKDMPVLLSTNDIVRMRINSNGNIGVGLNDPTERLEVAGFIKTRPVSQYAPNGININGSATISASNFPDYGTGTLNIVQGESLTGLRLFENKLRFGLQRPQEEDIVGLTVDENFVVGKEATFNGTTIFNGPLVFNQGIELPQTSFNNNVGFGTETPEEKLHVVDGMVKIQDFASGGSPISTASLEDNKLSFTDNFATYNIMHNSGPFLGSGFHITSGDFVAEESTVGIHMAGDKMILGKFASTYADINLNGQVLISNGTVVPYSNTSGGVNHFYDVPAGYQLAVMGKVICEEMRVKLRADWGDFVFDQNYDLMSLQDLESYIDENQHLPGVASAEILEQEGVDTGEMLRQQMVKIEELTLYVLELQKQIEELQSK